MTNIPSRETIWVANHLWLPDAIFLRREVYLHHQGKLLLLTFKLGEITTEGIEILHNPNLWMYHVKTKRLLDEDTTLAEQQVSKGDVFIIFECELDKKDQILKAIRDELPQFPEQILDPIPASRTSITLAELEELRQEQERKLMGQGKVINIGTGAKILAPITIADTIERSFNTLKESSLDESIKSTLSELLKVVTEASKSAPPEIAQSMARDVESLSKEVVSSQPRRKWYELSIEGLTQAAVSIGAVGKPILEVLQQLSGMLPKV